MNNPSPLVPQGSNLEQKNTSRARVRLAVFCVLSIHIVGLMALLAVQGCRKPQETELAPEPATNAVAPEMQTPTNIDTTTTATNTYVPPQPETNAYVPPAPQPAVGQEYTVVKGDSFATIAKKFPGVTAKQIQDANPTVQPTKIKIGQKLQIPVPSVTQTSTMPSTVAPVADLGGEQAYTVKSGDTLTTIASHHGTTVKALRAANSLTSDKIRVGQKLKIPSKASAPVTPPTTP